MVWHERDILNLIKLYQSRTLLWDPQHQDHYRKNLKEKAWREIGAQMKRHPDDIKQKIGSVLASYRRERNKILSSKNRGDEILYQSGWTYYPALKFLDNREIKKRLYSEKEFPDEMEDESTATTSKETPSNSTKNDASNAHPSKRLKSSDDNLNTPISRKCYQILKSTAAKLEKTDETSSFFKFAAAKCKNYSLQTNRGVQQAVFDILMKADRGFYDWPAPTITGCYSQGASNSQQNPPDNGQTLYVYPQQYLEVNTGFDSRSLSPNTITASLPRSPASSLGSESLDNLV